MTSRLKYSNEEKILIVNEYAKSGLSKWEFAKQHTEYKTGTLLKWLSKYFSSTNKEGEQTDSSDFSDKNKDSISKFKIVMETAKMNEVEVGAYCRSNGIYASELNSWKLNCMKANDAKNISLEKELNRLRAENKQLKEKDSKQTAALKSKDKELNRMKDALAEYAVKEAFLKKAQAFFGKNDEEQ
jgi:transposase-like protein